MLLCLTIIILRAACAAGIVRMLCLYAAMQRTAILRKTKHQTRCGVSQSSLFMTRYAANAAAFAEGLIRNSPVKASKGRAMPSSPMKTASRQEPEPPAKFIPRAMPCSPAKGPHTPETYETVTVFSRASAHSPAVRASSPTTSSKGMDETQDGRLCEPRRCSCCWAFTKASGTGSPL